MLLPLPGLPRKLTLTWGHLCSYTESYTFLPCYTDYRSQRWCSHFPLVSAQLLLPTSYKNLSLPQFMESSSFYFYHSLWPWCSQRPRSPSVWHWASCFHHPTGWFQYSWGKPTPQSWHSCLVFTALQFWPFASRVTHYAVSQSRTLWSQTLIFYSQNSYPCSFIPLTYSKLLMPGLPPTLSDRQYAQPDFFLP